MRTIIAGSRTIKDYSVVEKAVKASGFTITEVVSGNAAGVDKLGECYGANHNISVSLFPANWNQYGRSAGPIRNREMAENADALIAIWDGVSRGTKNMIDVARKLKLKVFVYCI